MAAVNPALLLSQANNPNFNPLQDLDDNRSSSPDIISKALATLSGNCVELPLDSTAEYISVGSRDNVGPSQLDLENGEGQFVAGTGAGASQSLLDARRMRKSVFRRTIDYNANIMCYLKKRIWQKDQLDRIFPEPSYLYQAEILPAFDYTDNPYTSITTKHVRTSTNKNKCPIYCVCWTPEGRRLITGAHSGEFTLWNGLTFNFETILQAHDHPIRTMKWSHNEEWMITADQNGYVKYWQANMNNVEVLTAHKDTAIRGVSFCPTDEKFATCSDDSTVRIWDFYSKTEERVLRGHGADVRCVAWHPHSSLLLSGSKDAQQPIKLWDAKSGESVCTLYVHKNTCTDVAWNQNGNWFLTASRDHLIKLFDLRNMKQEMYTFRGHKRDVMRLAWHPIHETLFASGSGDGALLFWVVGNEMDVGAITDAHESLVWGLTWHPLGHLLVSGSNDFTTKFWTRNRPGDILRNTQSTNLLANLPVTNVAATAVATTTAPSQSVTLVETTEEPKKTDLEDHRAFMKQEFTLDGQKVPSPPPIPGIGEEGPSAVPVTDHRLNESTIDEHDRIRGFRASRLIPREFQVNWASVMHAHIPSLMPATILDQAAVSGHPTISRLHTGTGMHLMGQPPSQVPVAGAPRPRLTTRAAGLRPPLPAIYGLPRHYPVLPRFVRHPSGRLVPLRPQPNLYEEAEDGHFYFRRDWAMSPDEQRSDGDDADRLYGFEEHDDFPEHQEHLREGLVEKKAEPEEATASASVSEAQTGLDADGAPVYRSFAEDIDAERQAQSRDPRTMGGRALKSAMHPYGRRILPYPPPRLRVPPGAVLRRRAYPPYQYPLHYLHYLNEDYEYPVEAEEPEAENEVQEVRPDDKPPDAMEKSEDFDPNEEYEILPAEYYARYYPAARVIAPPYPPLRSAVTYRRVVHPTAIPHPGYPYLTPYYKDDPPPPPPPPASGKKRRQKPSASQHYK